MARSARTSFPVSYSASGNKKCLYTVSTCGAYVCASIVALAFYFAYFYFLQKFDLLFPSLFTRRRDDDCELRGFSQLRRAAVTQTSVERAADEKRESSTATVYNTEYTLFGLDL